MTLNKKEYLRSGRRGLASLLAFTILLSPLTDTDAQTRSRKKRQEPKKETSAEVRRQADATQKEITRTKQQIRDNEAGVRAGLSELSRLQEQISLSSKRVETLNKKVGELGAEITALEKSMEKERQEIARLREEYLKAVKKMRTSRKNSSALAFIFSAENFNQGMRRMRYLREFSSWKEKRSQEITDKLAQLQREAERLEAARKEQAVALGKQKTAQAQLETQRAQQNKIVADLKAEGAALSAHLSKKQAEANALKNRIASLIAAEEAARKAEEERRRQEEARKEAARQEAARKAEEERRRKEEAARQEALRKAEAERVTAANEEARREATRKEAARQEAAKKEAAKKEKAKKEAARKEKEKKEAARKEQAKKEAARKEQTLKETTKQETPKQQPPKKETPRPVSGGGFASAKGSLPRPVDGHFRITGRFGRHSLPELPDVVYDNPGIDIEVAPGATAKAVYGGRVSGVYMLPGFGTVVIVNHGQYYTVYGNLSSASVKVGDEVKQGSAVGRVAPDPDDKNHGSLHFEVWKNRDKQDPSGWIR